MPAEISNWTETLKCIIKDGNSSSFIPWDCLFSYQLTPFAEAFHWNTNKCMSILNEFSSSCSHQFFGQKRCYSDNDTEEEKVRLLEDAPLFREDTILHDWNERKTCTVISSPTGVYTFEGLSFGDDCFDTGDDCFDTGNDQVYETCWLTGLLSTGSHSVYYEKAQIEEKDNAKETDTLQDISFFSSSFYDNFPYLNDDNGDNYLKQIDAFLSNSGSVDSLSRLSYMQIDSDNAQRLSKKLNSHEEPWAILVSDPMDSFSTLVPNPACTVRIHINMYNIHT